MTQTSAWLGFLLVGGIIFVFVVLPRIRRSKTESGQSRPIAQRAKTINLVVREGECGCGGRVEVSAEKAGAAGCKCRNRDSDSHSICCTDADLHTVIGILRLWKVDESLLAAADEDLQIETDFCPDCGKEKVSITTCMCDCPDDAMAHFAGEPVGVTRERIEELGDTLGIPRCALCNRTLTFTGQRVDIKLVFKGGTESIKMKTWEHIPFCRHCRSTGSRQDIESACKRVLDENGPSAAGPGFPKRYTANMVRDAVKQSLGS